MARHEDALHLAVAQALTVMIAPPGKLGPGNVCFFSIEHRNAQSAVEGAKRKARGVVAGVPDLLVLHAGQSIWIELKAEKGALSKEQRALHPTIAACGHLVFVCRSVEQVIGCLTVAGVPMRTMRVAA